jgi:hypothetical protein
MSKKNSSQKKVSQKRARTKAVKKKIREARLVVRKENKMEWLREQVFEREFKEKQNLNLSPEEVRATIEHNMKMLTAMNENATQEQIARMEAIKKAQEQMKQLEEIEAKRKLEAVPAEENLEDAGKSVE